MLLAGGRPADAHAFGARYDLPMPLDYFLAAAGAAVVLSFVIMAAFARRGTGTGMRTAAVLWRNPTTSPLWRALVLAVRTIGVLIFLLIVVAGLFGTPSPTENVAPLLVWVIWWVGFLMFCAFVGNLWPALDPWTSIRDLVLRDRGSAPPLAWPGRIAAWPAVTLFLAFAWAELVGPFGESPFALALVVLFWSALAWVGMTVFGRDVWIANADPFRRVFDLLGGFAIIGRGPEGEGRPLLLRLPAAGLLETRTGHLSDVVFVMAVLATVTFDGFSETPLWAAFLDWLARSGTLRPLLLGIAETGIPIIDAVRTFALLAAPAIIFGIYALFSALTALADRTVSTGQVIRAFAVSLLPIAIAYHLSHYLSYFLLAGQFAIPMASDPLGLGWNLFGTGNYMMNVGIITARGVWYVAVGALVTGHVISVIVAHSIAMRIFSTPRRAMLSQLPFLVLMVGFTACSLWILAQPVVNEPSLGGG